MSDAPSPCEAFLEWYQTTPAEVRDHLSFMLGGLGPGDVLAGPDSFSKLESSQLAERIRSLVQTTPFREVGVALTIRALVGFTFRGRETEADWVDARARNLSMAATAKEDGQDDIAEDLEDGVDRMALRSRQWIREAEGWSRLCESHLSDAKLDDWLKGAFIRHHHR